MMYPEYVARGERNYQFAPIPLNQRNRWEFQLILDGSARPDFPQGKTDSWEFGKVQNGPGTIISSQELSHSSTISSTPILHVFHPSSIHGWTADSPEPSQVAVIHFALIPGPVLELLGNRPWISFSLSNSQAQELATAIGEVAKNLQSSTPTLALILANQIFWNLAHILQDRNTVTPLTGSSVPLLPTEYDYLVRRILAWYDEHMQENPKVEDLSDIFYASRSTIHRAFQKVLGKGAKSAFFDIRMKRAKLLLQSTNASITQISQYLGYPDSGMFSRDFQKHTQCSPGQWRQLQRTQS